MAIGLKRIVRILLYAITLSVAMLTVCSCYRHQSRPAPVVVVFHSYPDSGLEGAYFRELMQKEFARHDVSAEIHHVYTDLLHNAHSLYTYTYWESGLRDSVIRWNPDIILVNDDAAFHWMTHIKDSLFLKFPIVFAGVTTVDKQKIDAIPNITGFEDRIDLAENLKLVERFSTAEKIVIPLDYSPTDISLRKQIRSFLADSVKNVELISILSPNTNSGPYSHWLDNTIEKVSYSNDISFIQVKYDLFSNFFLDNNHTPQFTAIREQFGEGDSPLFLCGYFTGLDTQVSDLVNCACKVLNGTPIDGMSVIQHSKGYYIDYRAMNGASVPMKYKSLRKEFTITNIPIWRKMPVLFIVLGLVLLGCIFLASKLKKKTHPDEKKIHRNDIIIQLIQVLVDKYHIHFWKYDGGRIHLFSPLPSDNGLAQELISVPINEFIDRYLHPDFVTQFNVALKNLLHTGKYKVPIKLSFDDGQSWHWWEIDYESRIGSGDTLYGLAILIDEYKNMEAEISNAVDQTTETMLKENFIANISHDIRTPLGAVTGFADLLSDPNTSIEDAETYSKIIKDNSEILLKLIEDVVTRSEHDESLMSISMAKTRITDLIYNCYKSNQILAPEGINFQYKPFLKESKVDVEADSLRITQVINNFLSNAFKFTDNGSITLGWTLLNDGNDVEVYVEDTGIGIPPDKLSSIFKRYEKVNESVAGTGLGLNICKEIIDNHGGRIKADSTLGKGSRFSFVIPVIKGGKS